MKCKHEEISIFETGDWTSSHEREKDGLWTHNQAPGGYHAMVNVCCQTCGKTANYSKYKMPKWLKKYWDEMLEQN